VFDFSISVEGDEYVLYDSLVKNALQFRQMVEGVEDMVNVFLALCKYWL
jgi:hypothetical protein